MSVSVQSLELQVSRQSVDLVASEETRATSAVAGTGTGTTVGSNGRRSRRVSVDGEKTSMELGSLRDQLQSRRQSMLGAMQTVECVDDNLDDDAALPAPNSDLKNLEAELESLRALDALAKRKKTSEQPDKLEPAPSAASLASRDTDRSKSKRNSLEASMMQQLHNTSSANCAKVDSSAEVSGETSPIFGKKATKAADSGDTATKPVDGRVSPTRSLNDEAPGPLPTITTSFKSSAHNSLDPNSSSQDAQSPNGRSPDGREASGFHRAGSSKTMNSCETETSVMFDGLKSALATTFNQNKKSFSKDVDVEMSDRSELPAFDVE